MKQVNQCITCDHKKVCGEVENYKKLAEELNHEFLEICCPFYVWEHQQKMVDIQGGR